MEKRKLTRKRVTSLKPRTKIYSVRDSELAGFGVRVSPTGGKTYFVHTQVRGRRKWHSLGSSLDLTEPQARSLAVASIAAHGDSKAPELKQAVFEVVGEMFFKRYRRNWKPATYKASLASYRDYILPFFTGMLIGEIDKAHVERWFAALGNRPGIANRALPVLSVMMQQAGIYGYRPDNANPCKGKARYRMAPKERFLTADELFRLGNVLEDYRKVLPLAVSFLELLIVTGCRKGEIAGLYWSDYRHGNLYLPDSKTGPKTVYLSTAARAVLDAIPRTDARVFPAMRSTRTRGEGQAGFCVDAHWRALREQSGLAGVRLHDLRHTYASVALEHGEHILVIGRLLGHADPETTLKYAHLANEQVQHTARAVSTAIAKVM